jgi:hypothetical protein
MYQLKIGKNFEVIQGKQFKFDKCIDKEGYLKISASIRNAMP